MEWDVRAVNAAAELAAKWCRDGNGPIILEMLTYRYRGHSMSDPAKYRTKEEVQKMRAEQDPIEQVKARVLDKKWASEEELKAIDKEVRDIVADSAEFAQSDPEPGRIRTLHRHIVGGVTMSAHFEIHATNVDRAKVFYGGLFGWTFTPMPGAGEMEYHLIEGLQIGPSKGRYRRHHATDRR